MARTPTLKSAVAWIALNDEDASVDEEFVANMISVQLVADVWGIDPAKVAAKVIAYRSEHDGQG